VNSRENRVEASTYQTPLFRRRQGAARASPTAGKAKKGAERVSASRASGGEGERRNIVTEMLTLFVS
jgi:hypothetical protein